MILTPRIPKIPRPPITPRTMRIPKPQDYWESRKFGASSGQKLSSLSGGWGYTWRSGLYAHMRAKHPEHLKRRLVVYIYIYTDFVGLFLFMFILVHIGAGRIYFRLSGLQLHVRIIGFRDISLFHTSHSYACCLHCPPTLTLIDTSRGGFSEPLIYEHFPC